MPEKTLEKTAEQWQYHLDVNALLKFDDDRRDLPGYIPFSEAKDQGLDAIAITGANLELADPKSPLTSDLLPFEKMEYYPELLEIIEWAENNTKLTVYSCLASHIALNHLFGLERDRSDQKVFGVFSHNPDNLKAPHSRWGNIPTKTLIDCDVAVVADNSEIGWLEAIHHRKSGKSVFLQGHPEYDTQDLALEYYRDKKLYNASMPRNYFTNNNPTLPVENSWRSSARKLFSDLENTMN